MYQYINLTGGLIASLFLKLQFDVNVSHVHISFCYCLVSLKGLIWWVFTLKVFPLGFLNSCVLSDRTLMTWYPLTNFLSKGFLVKFLTKTCVPVLYFGNILAYLSLFVAQWILIHLNSLAWVFQISFNCCKHFNPQFVPVYLCNSSSSFSYVSGSLP